jgi:hypothetical protein
MLKLLSFAKIDHNFVFMGRFYPNLNKTTIRIKKKHVQQLKVWPSP